jgi:hypothetical protein
MRRDNKKGKLNGGAGRVIELIMGIFVLSLCEQKRLKLDHQPVELIAMT